MKFGKSALYERMLQEKDRQIDILAEQIDYLRAQLAYKGTAVTTRPLQITAPSEGAIEVKPYVSDEELDVQAMLDAGSITEADVPQMLEALGLMPEIEFESVG